MGTLRSNTTFVRLFLGRLFTNIGDSIYLIAAMWLVHELTASPVYTGIMGFLIQLPQGLQFLAGPLVDRWSLHSVQVRTQLFQCVGVLVVPLVAFLHQPSVWLLLAVTPVLAFTNQFLYPAQNAALPKIVDEDNLVRANSLFSSAYRGANFVFNALSGVFIALIGAIPLFVLDSGVFAMALLLFLGVTVPSEPNDEPERTESTTDVQAVDDAEVDTEPPEDHESEGAGYVEELISGINYIRGSVVVAVVVGMMLSNVGMGAAFAVLPAFADSLGGAETYGLLSSAFAGGSLVGALASNLIDDRPYGVVCIVGFCTAGLSLFAALAVPGPIATSALFFTMFVPIGATNVMFFAMVQSAIADDYLGRAVSLVGSLNSAMMPFGSLFGGAVAGIVGVTTVFGGLATMLVSLGVVFFLHPELRSLPPIAESDEASLGLAKKQAS